MRNVSSAPALQLATHRNARSWSLYNDAGQNETSSTVSHAVGRYGWVLASGEDLSVVKEVILPSRSTPASRSRTVPGWIDLMRLLAESATMPFLPSEAPDYNSAIVCKVLRRKVTWAEARRMALATIHEAEVRREKFAEEELALAAKFEI